MTTRTPAGRHEPDPRRIATRRDFGVELTLARRASGLSVRRVARQVDVPASTLGGYFAGTHLPALRPADLLERLLRVLGVANDADLAAWSEAYWRVRGPGATTTAAESGTGVLGTTPPAAVSTRPPLDRLLVEPRLRGRRDILAALDAVIAAAGLLHDSPRVHVLYGLGGSGKSMVALTVAQRAAAAGVRTFWITANDAAATLAGMHALAIELGAPADRLRGGSLPDIVWRLLCDLDQRWLLVFDNANDPPLSLTLPGQLITDGTGWLRPPDRSLGAVLVTTRDGHPAHWGDPAPPWLQIHRLIGLARADGAEVLMELAGPAAGDVGKAGDLADRLGGLPLALMLAGRFLRESQDVPAALGGDLPRDFVGYLAALGRGDQTELFAPGTMAGDSRTRASVGRSWDLSVELLTDRGLRSARPLLHTLACFGVTPIPYGLLLRAEVLAASPLFPGATPHEIWNTLRGLDGVGLLTLTGADDTAVLRIHPLVRDVARADDGLRAHLSRYLSLTTALLNPVIRDAEPKSPSSWARWRLIADHCTAPLALLDMRAVAPDTVRAAVLLAGRASSYLRAAGLLDQAESAFEQTLPVATDRLGQRDPVTLVIAHDFARLRYDQGRLPEAEQAYRAVLAARQRVLGEQHPDTLMTQHYLARTLRARGRLDVAERLFSDTYAVRLRLLGDRHPDTLTSRHGIADVLRDRGESTPALATYLEVLALRTQLLGERHPATLVTRQYAAEMQHALGDLESAEVELRAVWEISQEVRGPHHPRTLAGGQSLVELLHDRGRLAEAEGLAVAVVAARRRLLGDTHPATLASRHRLGLIRLDRGEVGAARRDLQAVLVDRRQVLGPDHPHTELSRRLLDAVARRAALPQQPTARTRRPPGTATHGPDRGDPAAPIRAEPAARKRSRDD
ncbi:tetratricopeptide repeat protein [Micromonospora sp. NPDC049645]|uniref:tetratricopeptide repeat protein n=1 Tax=Micromonospora sp. NPDC049645 TaxID=3155508 RepID=UPI0034496B28